jgi:signal transduction histidine kinase
MGVVSPEILLNVKALRGKRFEAQHELSVYRLTQEIINNCLKHAKAQSLVLNFALEMRIKNNVQEEWLTVTAEDEGVGFQQETLQKKGLGLSTMQNRVHALGGTLQINSVVGRGTRIVAEIPLREVSIAA